jgi:hypothetical protein
VGEKSREGLIYFLTIVHKTISIGISYINNTYGNALFNKISPFYGVRRSKLKILKESIG